MNTLTSSLPTSAFANTPLDRLRQFFFAPATTKPFAVLRVLTALVLLAQAISIAPYFSSLHGSAGFLQGSLGETLNASGELPGIPKLAQAVGISSDRLTTIVAATYVLALLGLLVGAVPRAAALAAWGTHTLLITSGSATKYGADEFAQIALFYLVLFPGREFALPGLRSRAATAGELPRFCLRLLQFHLCVAYLATAYAKAQGEQWWNGEAIWRSLTLPIYTQFDVAWLARFPWLAKLSAWGTLLVEGGYAFFIWPRATRKLWIALVVSLHLGIAIFLGLWVFGLLMCALTISAFLVWPEPAQ